jgi:hypothetical protein
MCDFLDILNGFVKTEKKYKSIDGALDKAPPKLLSMAFIVLAVAKGARAMTWQYRSWTPPKACPYMRSVSVKHGSLRFFSIFNTKLLSEKDYEKLMSEYIRTRHNYDRKVEKKVGEALGYIHPSGYGSSPASFDAGLAIYYSIELKDGRKRRIRFYDTNAQSVSLSDPKLNTKISNMKRVYEKLVQDVSKRIDVEPKLTFY